SKVPRPGQVSMPICQPKSLAAEVDVGVAVKTAMPPPLAALQVTWLPSGATLMSFTVTAMVSLAVPQLGLLWLVTVIFKVAVPTFDSVSVGSSAVASEKLTIRSEGLLESTVHRIVPLDAVAAIANDLPSSSHFFWSGPAAAAGSG